MPLAVVAMFGAAIGDGCVIIVGCETLTTGAQDCRTASLPYNFSLRLRVRREMPSSSAAFLLMTIGLGQHSQNGGLLHSVQIQPRGVRAAGDPISAEIRPASSQVRALQISASPRASTAALVTTLRSSRTFPGQ